MSQKHHVRSQSQGRKLLPAHARPSKPPLLKRGSSYNHAHSHSQSGSSSKSGPGWSKKVGTEVVAQQEVAAEEEDMASFLHFCAFCEKQIVTPGTSILYCSEACRKRDVSQVTPLHHSPTLTPSIPSHSDSQPPDILPQRSPTVLRPVSFAFSDMSISELGSPIEELEGQIGRRDSEAARYLAQFRSSTWDGESSSTRRRNNRISTATDDSGLPSLIHSPSSSVGTVASAASIRPSLSRQNKSYSSCSGAPLSPTQAAKDASFKSSASTLTAFRVAEAGDFSYDKRSASRKGSEAQGSLKQLFSHEAMKAPPTQASQISQTD